MKNKLILLLKRLLSALDPPSPLLGEVRGLVSWAEAEFGPGRGERKRSQVLSRLAHAHPTEKVRDLAFLIEKVLQEDK